MKFEELFPYSFKHLEEEFNLPSGERTMVDCCRADDSELCLEMLREPYHLTEEQMHHAAERYRLGKSRSGKTIYWMIDEMGICHDGHVGCDCYGAETWVSTMLKRRFPEVAKYIRPQHCLFGLHLLETLPEASVAIVERERSAVILSEMRPECLWMATAYPANFTMEQLEPLQGHRVTLFPRTDPCLETYLWWLNVADMAQRRYQLEITVSDILERCCSPEQKEQCVDVLEFIEKL